MFNIAICCFEHIIHFRAITDRSSIHIITKGKIWRRIKQIFQKKTDADSRCKFWKFLLKAFNEVPIVFCLVLSFAPIQNTLGLEMDASYLIKLNVVWCWLSMFWHVLTSWHLIALMQLHITHKRILIIDKVRMDMDMTSHLLYLRLIEIKAMK